MGEMSERDKRNARDIIDAYRRRQRLTQTAILLIGLVVVVLAGVLIFVLPGLTTSSPPPQESPSPTPEGTFTPTPSPTETLLPTDTIVPLLSGTPLVEATSSGSGTSIYVVKEGDTLATIATQLNVDFQTLLSLNPDIDPDLIVVGQEIVVPGGQGQATGGAPTPLPENFSGLIEYQVVAGDTLLDIANRFNTTVDAIVAENGLENANDIRTGDVLQIPVNAGATAPTATSSNTPNP